MTLTELTFTSCTSGGHGGAIYIVSSGANTLAITSVTMDTCTSTGNGGGMYWCVSDDGATMTATSLVFKGCVATTPASESDYSMEKGCGGSLYIDVSTNVATSIPWSGMTFTTVGSEIESST